MNRIVQTTGLVALAAVTACTVEPSGPGEEGQPGEHAQLTIIAGDKQTAASFATLPVALEIAITTADGTVLRGLPLTWSVAPGSGTLTDMAAVTDDMGRATAKWTIGKTGNQTVTVSVTKRDVQGTFTATAVIPTRIVALHYDGTSWTPSLQETNAAFPTGYAVWGSSASDIIVAGAKCDGAFIARFNGTSWSDLAGCDSPGATIARYEGVWGNSPSDVYAILWPAVMGSGITHYNGSTWTNVYPYTAGLFLYSIWSKAPSTVVAVGSAGQVVRYDGTTWTRSTQTGKNLFGVWGDATTSAVFAVGDAGTILYYDGTAWHAQVSGTTQNLAAVWGTSATNVYAVGAGGTILHFNGTTWSAQTSGSTKNLNGIWGSSATSIFAVGEGEILRFDGTTWTRQNVSVPMTFLGVWGTSPTNVYAVGSGPTE